jgi:cysteinyl-tRNA synthetase
VPFVKYWLHNAFLRVEGEKMSKSLGNYITVRDAIEKHGADVIRFFFTINPYYRPIDYAEGKIEDARIKLKKIRSTTENLQIAIDGEGKIDTREIISHYREKFIRAMDDNFNTAEALGVIFDYVRKVNDLIRQNGIDRESAGKLLQLFSEFGDILGVEFIKVRKDEITDEQMQLIKEREEARKNKNWSRSDEIRDILLAQGIALEDSQTGTVWKKVK